MKKLTVFLLVFLFAFMAFGLTDNVVQADSQAPTGGQFQFTWTITMPGQEPANAFPGSMTVDYGQKVTFDAGTPAGHTLLGYQVNGKVELDTQRLINTGLPVTEDTLVNAFFKLDTETAVIFMDANQDYIEMKYTGLDNKVIYSEGEPIPDHLANPKPGLQAMGWTANGTDLIDFDVDTFTQDTVVFVKYGVDPSQSQATLSVVNGSIVNPPANNIYDFNDVATVATTEMNGSDFFQYWLKDGIVASLDPVYSFTMIEDVTLEAVFSDVDNYDSDDLFITISNPYPIKDDFNSFVGQFSLPDGHELIEYGLLTSPYEGGITFSSPELVKIRSNKYFPVTNEFMMSLPDTMTSAYRAYMITSDGVDTTITYSLAIKPGFAEDLFISEYIEGSSNNKAIEIFNGTGQEIDLTDYSIELYSSGSAPAKYTVELEGAVANNDVYVIFNSSSSQAIVDEGDISDTVTYFNGNDVILLKKSGVIIDIIGELNVDDNFGANKTFVRNNDVTQPYVGMNGSNEIWDILQWTEYNEDTFSYLGSHEIDLPLIPVLASEVPASITINGSDEVNVNESITLSETYPSGGLEGVFWASSNELVATVDPVTGEVSGVAEGLVTINAYSFFDHDVIASQGILVTPIQTYDVTFDSNGGSGVATQPINGGNSAIEPDNPTLADNEFAGWYTDNTTFLKAYNFATPVGADITLFAKWNEIYDITYNLNDGTNDVSNPATYTVETATITLAEPTRVGYVFNGWYEEIDFSGTEVTEITLGSTGDIILYADWTDEAVAETTYVETFNNCTVGSGYANGSFVGVNSVTWNYVASRDENGDANNSGIDGNALMLRRSSDSSAITSSTISGGISSFSVKLYKGFTGGGGRQVELWINGSLVATSTSFDDFDEHIFTVENINITGDIIIEIRNITSKQIIIDDITWTTNSNPA